MLTSFGINYPLSLAPSSYSIILKSNSCYFEYFPCLALRYSINGDCGQDCLETNLRCSGSGKTSSPCHQLQQRSRALKSQSKQDLAETEDSDSEWAKTNHKGAHARGYLGVRRLHAVNGALNSDLWPNVSLVEKENLGRTVSHSFEAQLEGVCVPDTELGTEFKYE